MNHMTRILPPRSVTPNLMNWSSYTSLMEQPKQFEQLGLDPVLLRAVRALGYESPTSIQREGIPAILAGRDVIGTAETGSGKTAAYLLPIIQRLSRQPPGR